MNILLIAQRIRRIREYRNYTQAYVAKQLNIRQNTYSQIEKGVRAIKSERLIQIAAILDCPVANIVDDTYEVFRIDDGSISHEQNATETTQLVSELKTEIGMLRLQTERVLSELEHMKALVAKH